MPKRCVDLSAVDDIAQSCDDAAGTALAAVALARAEAAQPENPLVTPKKPEVLEQEADPLSIHASLDVHAGVPPANRQCIFRQWVG